MPLASFAAILENSVLISLATFVARAFASACLASAILMSFVPSFINTPFSAFVAVATFAALPVNDKSFVAFVNSSAKSCICLAEFLKFAISVANCVL